MAWENIGVQNTSLKHLDGITHHYNLCLRSSAEPVTLLKFFAVQSRLARCFDLPFPGVLKDIGISVL